MKITNRQNLPEIFLNAVKPRLSTSWSPSAIARSPRQYWLNQRHFEKLSEDVSSRIWAILGSSVHAIIANHETTGQKETRLTTQIGDYEFTGIPDLIENNIIYDYKITSVWTIVYKSFEDWENQLNCYSYLASKNGIKINSISVIAILRDWQKSKAKYDPNYPQSQVIKIDLPLWELGQQENHIRSSIELIAKEENTPDNDLPLCTDKERWKDPDKYAVMQKGKKRAVKIHMVETEANDHAGKDIKYYVEYRPSTARKCEDYCPVKDFCKQYKEEVCKS